MFEMCRRVSRRASRGAMSVIGLMVAVAVLSAWAGAGSPAQAASAPVTIRSAGSTSLATDDRVVVRPRYSARADVRVRSATVDVRRSSSWVARGVRSAKLSPGTYRVTSRVTYRVRAQGRLGRTRTQTRTDTVRVTGPVAATAPAPAPAPSGAAPVPRPEPSSSLAATGTPCSSTSLLKPDGRPWECTFSEEFSGTSLDTDKWVTQETASSGYRLGDDCYVDDSENVSVGDGRLALTVRKKEKPFVCSSPSGDYTVQHTAGMVSTWNSFAQANGRFEIRAAFPKSSSPGLHSALWLFPKDSPYGGFPSAGEIDIAEMYSNWSDRVIPYVHYLPTRTDPTVTNNYCMIDDVSQFHTYTLEWTPTTISIAYDGVTCMTHRIAATSPFDWPFIMVLTQGLGVGDNAVTPTTPTTGTTYVDYVRIWK